MTSFRFATHLRAAGIERLHRHRWRCRRQDRIDVETTTARDQRRDDLDAEIIRPFEASGE